MYAIEKRIKIPPVLKKMREILAAGGFQAYLVGGAVRDMLMGGEPHDYDVATDASPKDVMRLFRRVVPTGAAHGTVTVHLMGHHIETTTFRTESNYSDGRHPDSVRYAATIEEDLSRRDFTMNAVAVNLADESVVDPYGGIADIEKKIIRAVGNPHERFSEDGLRPIRAIRFAAQLKFHIEENTAADIYETSTLAVVKKISIERFRDEFIKMLETDEPSLALGLMERTGLLAIFIPELLACRGCVQSDFRGFHEFDVLDHLFYACDGAPKSNLDVRLAALFHDIGKPATKRVEFVEFAENGESDAESDGKRGGENVENGGDKTTIEKITFYEHETVGAEMTKKILTRLRFPAKTALRVAHLVETHMFHYEENWSDAAVRRFIVRVGRDCLDDLFDLRLADIYGMHRVPVRLHDSLVGKNLTELKERISRVESEKAALGLKDLAVNGDDLIALGIPKGREIGRILNELFNVVLDDPAQNTREDLLAIAGKIRSQETGDRKQ